MNGISIAGGIVALMLLWAVISYNRFVNQRNLIGNSWSNIDTELRRRYDLIPNLVETVKGYVAHERAVLEEVTAARAAAAAEHGSPEEQARAEAPLVTALRHLFVVVEDYPTLQSSSHFLDLQHELSNTEDRIQASRRFYNANVRDYNTRVQSLPSNVIAGLFNFDLEEYFQIEPAMRTTVEQPPNTYFA
ncbi:MAG TPA: LemA family protein [Actinomycetota bacterium]|nr:LemA family protein [Actinomycetota bacterium]